MKPVRLRSLTLVLTTSVLAGCGFIPAPYQVDLYDTSWSIATIDGNRPTVDTTLIFNPGGVDSRASLVTDCGNASMSVTMDSDGDQLGLYDFAVDQAECKPEDAATLASEVALLATVEEWRVLDEHRIVLVGASQIELLRQN